MAKRKAAGLDALKKRKETGEDNAALLTQAFVRIDALEERLSLLEMRVDDIDDDLDVDEIEITEDDETTTTTQEESAWSIVRLFKLVGR